MSCDDSFNDSDEIFNLYSSKNVTETFKAQFKKIFENNKHLTNVINTSPTISEEISSGKDTNTNEEISVANKKQEVNSAKDTTKEQIEDFSLNKSSGLSEEQYLDDSLEIIEEFTPKPKRQSERLRKKRQGNNERDSSGVSSNATIVDQVTHKRRQRSKRKNQKKKGEPVDEITLEDSPQSFENDDELNPEVSVKVIWKSVNVKKFMIRKFQKLSHIFDLLSKEENIEKDKIILTFNNIRINENDTPDSLNLQVYHFLDGGVVNESTNLCLVSNSNISESDDKSVRLKFQDVTKKIITVNLNKNDKMKVGMIMCSEQLEIPLHKIKFFFDGELIQPSETPESLGLEGGEVIDIKITDKH